MESIPIYLMDPHSDLLILGIRSMVTKKGGASLKSEVHNKKTCNDKKERKEGVEVNNDNSIMNEDVRSGVSSPPSALTKLITNTPDIKRGGRILRLFISSSSDRNNIRNIHKSHKISEV